MTRDEHRALAEKQIEESDRLFEQYKRQGSVDEVQYHRISHLRQSAIAHALLGRPAEPRFEVA